MQATMAPALTVDAPFKKGLSGEMSRFSLVFRTQGRRSSSLEIWGPWSMYCPQTQKVKVKQEKYRTGYESRLQMVCHQPDNASGTTPSQSPFVCLYLLGPRLKASSSGPLPILCIQVRSGCRAVMNECRHECVNQFRNLFMKSLWMLM